MVRHRHPALRDGRPLHSSGCGAFELPRSFNACRARRLRRACICECGGVGRRPRRRGRRQEFSLRSLPRWMVQILVPSGKYRLCLRLRLEPLQDRDGWRTELFCSQSLSRPERCRGHPEVDEVEPFVFSTCLFRARGPRLKPLRGEPCSTASGHRMTGQTSRPSICPRQARPVASGSDLLMGGALKLAGALKLQKFCHCGGALLFASARGAGQGNGLIVGRPRIPRILRQPGGRRRGSVRTANTPHWYLSEGEGQRPERCRRPASYAIRSKARFTLTGDQLAPRPIPVSWSAIACKVAPCSRSGLMTRITF